MIYFPDKLNQLLLRINQSGHDAYFVGGCVRDAVLGRHTNDIDITTNAPLEVLKEQFAEYDLTIFSEYGNISFQEGLYRIEITMYRKDLEYYNHRHPSKIEFNASQKDDTYRRDFTINALMYHPQYGIIDNVGGMDDLDQKIIRTLIDPSLSFEQDYLRMMRALRFASQLSFKIDKAAFNYINEHFHHINDLSISQWEEELNQFIMGEAFYSLAHNNPWILGTLIQPVKEAIAFEQDNPYHAYSLYEHTIRVMSELSTLEMRLVGLFHDLGKLRTQIFTSDGIGRYPGHAQASVEIMDEYLEFSIFTKEDKREMLKLVEYHDLSIPENYIEFKKLVSIHGIDFMQKLVQFKRADNIAKSEKAYYQVEKCVVYQTYIDRILMENPVLTLKQLAIKGNELDVEPQKRKKTLEKLLELVIEEKVVNEKNELINKYKEFSDDIYKS